MILQKNESAAAKNTSDKMKWVHRGLENKKVLSSNTQSYLDNGWEIGRQIKAELTPRKKHRLVCVKCGVSFNSKRKDRERCNHCTKSDSGKIAAQRGTHAGWHYRKGETSYPEKYFEDILQKEGITGWAREKKVGRWFIDFAFFDRMLAVEIDGRQHEESDRAAMDKLKDEYLTLHGWTVIRIKWYNPRTEQGKQRLYPQVKLLLSQVR